ncbi:hypothetical protein T492DRAFT_942351 [Pavlovales sp. CCMP2436]|nr:hypothetical protein T492DRAFT_942351 [Pavlovales sp. CCMP2436]
MTSAIDNRQAPFQLPCGPPTAQICGMLHGIAPDAEALSPMRPRDAIRADPVATSAQFLPMDAHLRATTRSFHYNIYLSFHRAPALRPEPCTRERVLDIQNPIASQRYVTGGITNGLACSRTVGRPRDAQRRQRFVFGFLIIHHFYQVPTSA